jgi:hypothetical protein
MAYMIGSLKISHHFYRISLCSFSRGLEEGNILASQSTNRLHALHQLHPIHRLDPIRSVDHCNVGILLQPLIQHSPA